MIELQVSIACVAMLVAVIAVAFLSPKRRFAFEQWLERRINGDTLCLANDDPTSVKRHMHGKITYLASTTQSGGATSTAAPWTARYQCVIFGIDTKHAYLGQTAGEVILGICDDSPDVPGDPIDVSIPDSWTGTQLATANGAIAAGTFLESAGNGNVQAWASGSTNCCIGCALTAATALGDYIEITLTLNPGSGQTVIASATGLTA